MARRAPLVIPALSKHTATVIFIHGLGDTGNGWAPAVENWRRREKLSHVKFILPHAPQIPITCNFGMQMPGWFDIKTLDGSIESLQQNEDEEGIFSASAYFHGLLHEEITAGTPSNRIVIGGFSQGGAMSLLAGLSFEHKLAGIVGLSCWMVLGPQFKNLVMSQNKETPIFMGHGTQDMLVTPVLGKMTHDKLKEMGYDVKMKPYQGMGHSACPEELDDVEEFLKERIPATEKK